MKDGARVLLRLVSKPFCCVGVVSLFFFFFAVATYLK